MFIQIRDLTKYYDKYLAVNKINFQIERNKTIGLLGPNGCGKTTTIGMLLGLITPSSGEILVDNTNLENLNREKILSDFNFASPYVELPKKLTVRENLEMGAFLRDENIEEILGRIYDLFPILKE